RLDALGDERHVVAALVQHRAEQVLEEVLGDARRLQQVGERDLRLHHPELGQVAGGVRVLGAEGRAEGVDLAQRQRVALDVELAGHGEEGLAPEEVVAEIRAAVVTERQVAQVEGRDPEHLTRALGVGGGDERGRDPEIALLVEVAVHGLGQAVADPGDGAEQVGARAQVGDLAQELERVRLGLDRVGLGVLDPADDLDGFGLDLERLALALGGGEGRSEEHRAARGQALHLGLVVGQRGRGHDLDRGEAGTVADVDEAQAGLGVAAGADPAADGDFAADRPACRERVFDADCGHPRSLAEPRAAAPGKSWSRVATMDAWPSSSLPPPSNAFAATSPPIRRRSGCASACAARAARAGATWPSWPGTSARATPCSSPAGSASTWTPTAWPWSTAPRSTSSRPA